MQALRRVLLGDNPIRAGVGQTEVDQPAQVERGSSVMQRVIILGGAAVAQPAVAAGQPGDGAFDHGPMLAVFGQPVRVSGCLPGGAHLRVMGPTLSLFPCGCARSGQPEQAVPKVANPLRLIGRVSPLGQVAVRSWWSTVKSSTVNPPGMSLGTGAGLTRSIWPRSASQCENP